MNMGSQTTPSSESEFWTLIGPKLDWNTNRAPILVFSHSYWRFWAFQEFYYATFFQRLKLLFQIERRGRSEEKRSSWQPYRVALSDEAGPRGNEPGSDQLNEEDSEEDEAVYGKPIKYTFANNKNKDNKWSNRRAGNDNAIFNWFFSLVEYVSSFVVF